MQSIRLGQLIDGVASHGTDHLRSSGEQVLGDFAASTRRLLSQGFQVWSISWHSLLWFRSICRQLHGAASQKVSLSQVLAIRAKLMDEEEDGHARHEVSYRHDPIEVEQELRKREVLLIALLPGEIEEKRAYDIE